MHNRYHEFGWLLPVCKSNIWDFFFFVLPEQQANGCNGGVAQSEEWPMSECKELRSLFTDRIATNFNVNFF